MGKPRRVIYNDHDVRGIRRAAFLAARAREFVASRITAGMTTLEIDQLAGNYIIENGGRPAFLNYHGFPANICISVNDEVVHGIGCDSRIISNGDVVAIDVGVYSDGFYGDTAETVIVGDGSFEDEKLVEYTSLALIEAAKCAISGNFIKDISMAVENTANYAKLAVVREYVGHGCGAQLHEPPEIPNYYTGNKGVQLQPGMVLCIEPMFTLGESDVYTDRDGWTVRTRDNKRAAHFEHMVLVTETDPEILTCLKML